jgi:tetratricopeptide (TPR) repeat protein
LNGLIYQIKIDQNERQHFKFDEALSISIINPNDHSKEQSSTGLDGQFIHSQLLIDCLIRMKSLSTDKNDLISLCKQIYKKNRGEQKIVREFERKYSPDRSIWWYTRQSFLYRLLNKALRVQNIHLLFLFRFFIRDLGEQLENNKCLSSVHVYRGQLMCKEEIEVLVKSRGELISMNSFFSTSINQKKARSFLSYIHASEDVEQIFFEIHADPRVNNSKPFSNITSYSYYPKEEEVIFMIGSIFRLDDIKYDNNDGVWNIKLSLCSDNNHQLQPLFRCMSDELGTGETNLYSFGHVLRGMGKLDDAEKYFWRFLNQLPDNHPDIAFGYHALGMVADSKGDYDSSLEFYNKRLEIQIRTLESDDPELANVHNSIANIYRKIGDCDRALDSYEKASLVLMKAFGDNHLDLATCLNSMGLLYQKVKQYWEALKYHQKALLICEQHLPADHPRLGAIHNNIGIVYRYLAEYDQALEHYHLSLRIKSKSLPPQHPDIAMTLKNIGNIHEAKGEFQEAFDYFEKAAIIYQQSLSSTHPYLIKIKDSIRRVSFMLR